MRWIGLLLSVAFTFPNRTCIPEDCCSLHIRFHTDASFFCNLIQSFFRRITLANQIGSQHCTSSSYARATTNDHRVILCKHSINKIHEFMHVSNVRAEKSLTDIKAYSNPIFFTCSSSRGHSILRQKIARRPSFHNQLSCGSLSGLALPASLPSITHENLAGSAKRREIAKQTHHFCLSYYLLKIMYSELKRNVF